MPISIQCSRCQSQYKVDDKVAGKRVKCKQCGNTILVPSGSGEPELLDIDALETPAPSAPSAAPAAGAGRRCPSCQAPMGANAVMCMACGFNPRSKKADAPATPIPLFMENEPKKKSRFVRAAGLAILESVDGMLRVVALWMMLIGVVVWGVHLARQQGGFGWQWIAPMVVLLGLVGIVMAPPAAIAISATVNMLKLIPRDDNYMRVLMALSLPLSTSLLCSAGDPNNPLFGMLIGLSWVVAVAMFIYLFRADMVEWVASVVVGAVAIGIGWMIASWVSPYIAMATGPLYTEATPKGVWQQFSTGPIPPPATQAAPVVTTAPIIGQAAETQLVSVVPGAGEPKNTGELPAPTAAGNTGNVPATPGGVIPAPGGEAVAPSPGEKSPLVLDVIEPPELQQVREIFVPPASDKLMLVVREGADGQVAAERWSINPPAKKAELSFTEVPKQPNSYIISPDGKNLVTLSQFPRLQLQVSQFENKNFQKKIPLDRFEREGGTPTLIGFMSQESTKFMMRWSHGSLTDIQVWGMASDMPKTLKANLSETRGTPFAMDPKGQFLATTSPGNDGQKQIVFYNMDTLFMMPKRISPFDTTYEVLGMDFSPDGGSIAMCAVAGEVTSVTAFKKTGEELFTGILPKSTFAKGSPGGPSRKMAHGLVWLRIGSMWLVAGNDLYDSTTGRKLGSLGVKDVDDVIPAGADTVLLIHNLGESGKSVTIVKFDPVQVKAAIDKGRI